MANAALAQTAPANDAKDDPSAQAIVVTGIRGSLSKALETKRNSQVIVDSISAQDIGALPDRTVSEALQRVPGITLQRTGDVNTLEGSDPGRVPAEGGGVFIRGLSWTRSELNGHDVFSANSGRGLSFEDVSPDLMGSVDVYKTPSADMVEGGIAGIVDLRTRKPLDSKGFLAVSADWNYADQRKQGYFSGNAVLSHRWDVDGVEVGVLLSAATGKTGNRTDAVQTGSISTTVLPTAQAGLAAGTTVALPSGLGYRSVDWTQVRHSYDAVLQVRTSPDLLFTFEGLVAKTTPRDIEHAVGINDQNGGFSLDPSFKFNGPGNSLSSGTLTNAQLLLDTRSGQEDKVTREFSGSMKWKPADHWTVDVDIDHVSSHASVYSMSTFNSFGATAAARPTVAFDLTGNNPSLNITPGTGAFNDPSQYFWTAAMDHIEDNYASSWAERADITYDLDNGGFLQAIKFGLRNTSKDLLTQSSIYNWSLLSAAYWGGGTPVFFNQDPGGTGLPAQTGLYSFGNFLGGKVNVPSAWFANNGLVTNGTANAYHYLAATENAGWGWSPLTASSFASSANAQNGYGTNMQREKTLAGYVMARFGQDDGLLGHFDGNIGLRVVRTRNTADGFQMIPPLQNAQTVAGCTAANGAAACQDLANVLTFVGSGSSTPVSYRNSYTDLLPELNTRFYLSKDTILRLAVGKTISRPSFVDMQANQTYNFTFQSNGYQLATVAPLVVNGGNPNLKPIKSWNFDASFEYYFGKANAFTFAAFYKDISNYISSMGGTQSLTRNGVTEVFQYNPAINGGHGNIKGFELGYTMFFDKLPGLLSGLGFNGNYTFISNSGGRNPANIQAAVGTVFAGNLPMQGLSKNSLNAALLYEKHGVSARLAYNWRSEYMSNANGANVNQPVWNEAYGQLDGSVIVDLTRWVKVGIQAQNLLKAATYIDVGPAALHPRYAWEQSDRHIAVLLRSKF
ncbi:MAG: TonB-dependent receptor [Sphingomonadales bacterium]|nr:TonB-dependent receptor [Sphingomonadales bacterium]MDE2170596.1 TonB-dependent receptor [Sphingomonadales bacterium]